MISVFIISGQSVTPNFFPTKLGVALQVLTLLIFGSSRHLHVNQTDRRPAFQVQLLPTNGFLQRLPLTTHDLKCFSFRHRAVC